MTSWLELKLPDGEQLKRLILFGGFRFILSVGQVHLWAVKQLFRLGYHCTEAIEKGLANYCQIVDASVWGGTSAERILEAKTIPLPAIEAVTDILEVLEGKHGLLIGGTGDGKTTTAMYLAYTIGGTITVYDADAEKNEWLGLNCIGRCGDFNAIEAGMKADLEDLQQRMELRGKQGDSAIAGMESVSIAEEFPLLVDEVPSAAKWLVKHGKRGRRAKRFVLAIAQNDTVKNFGFDGDSGVTDCFRMIRIGKKAYAFARKLKNDALIDWLRADRSRILVDDIPVQLPPYREIQRVIQQGSREYSQVMQQLPPTSEDQPVTAPEPTENQAFPPTEPSYQDSPESLLEQILSAFEQGKSDDWVTKKIYGSTGGSSYYRDKDRVAAIRARVER